MADDEKTKLVPVLVSIPQKSPLWEGIKKALLIGVPSAILSAAVVGMIFHGRFWKNFWSPANKDVRDSLRNTAAITFGVTAASEGEKMYRRTREENLRPVDIRINRENTATDSLQNGSHTERLEARKNVAAGLER